MHSRLIDLVGVPFDGSGRVRGQAVAPAALRNAGLAHHVEAAAMEADIETFPPTPERGPHGFINEEALWKMTNGVFERTTDSLRAGRLPVFYGGDCAVLLGAIPAVRAQQADVGLLFFDAHEDATKMAESRTGEAANMEIGLLLGLDKIDTKPHLAALQPEQVVLLGQRDEAYRRSIGVGSICDRVQLYPMEALRDEPKRVAAEASRRLKHWWLHIDLDVLSGTAFVACDGATDPNTPGGLTWDQLEAAALAALEVGTCYGMSVGVYNTDLDPSGEEAARIVRFLGRLLQ